jgi:UDP-2-acetamido-2,6-beta-L-arabino-hexul-4-ose reductase
MLKVGITGQSGFIGTHLFNFFNLKKEELIVIPFDDNFFQIYDNLKSWVIECDVIIHLAGMNRHADESVIYDTNIRLVKQLIEVLEESKKTPHLLFASSLQEIRDNKYGKSKKEGRELFANWAKKNNARFTGLVIPNVFGPFGNPYYNSVVATFSYQLTHFENPKIDVDGKLKLIYVGELAEVVYKIIIESITGDEYLVSHSSEKKVSEILKLLNEYNTTYSDTGIIPKLKDRFEVNLFNTFRSYLDHKNRYPVFFQKKIDDRGLFVEVTKAEVGGQISFSSTKSGITRGNHFHTRKIERFAVIKGEALIQLRQVGKNEVMNFYLSGEKPSYVDMPVWFTHNITNVGKEELLTFFWINEFYNEEDPDTFLEIV